MDQGIHRSGVARFNNRMYANIQGNILRKQQLADLRLVETAYPSGLNLPLHCHECAAFGFVLHGHYQEEFSSGTLSCERGSVFYRPPGIIHRNTVDQLGVRCLYLELSPKWLERAVTHKSFLGKPMAFHDSRLAAPLLRIHEEWRENDNLSALMIEGLACELTAEFYRSFRDHSKGQPPPWLKTVCDLVLSRFLQPMSLAEIAQEVGVHRVYVSRQFHRFYGTTLGEFVRRRRVEYACKKLLDPDMPMINIALESGFAHQAHFANVFKKVTGMTPSHYRHAMGVRRTPKHHC